MTRQQSCNQFIKVVESRLKEHHEFEKYEDYVTEGDKDGEDSKKFYEGDDIDISSKEILKAIKEKQEHPNGGTFDNWITLYVAKAVSAMDQFTQKSYAERAKLTQFAADHCNANAF